MQPSWFKQLQNAEKTGFSRNFSLIIHKVFRNFVEHFKEHFNGGSGAMKRFTLLLVAVIVFNSVTLTQVAQAQEASQTARVKTEVQKRGIGEKSRVKVRLRNKAEVKGYISKVDDASFDVTDKSTGRATTIPYADVEKVQGSGLSKGAKIGIIVGATVVIVAVVIAVGVCSAGYC